MPFMHEMNFYRYLGFLTLCQSLPHLRNLQFSYGTVHVQDFSILCLLRFTLKIEAKHRTLFSIRGALLTTATNTNIAGSIA